MLDEGPSTLYDALSTVLGLEDLVMTHQALAKARTERTGALKDAEKQRELVRQMMTLLLDQGATSAHPRPSPLFNRKNGDSISCRVFSPPQLPGTTVSLVA